MGYVLHLEQALEQANDAILTNTSISTKHPNNNKFCALVQKLESDAQDRGETGLAISLSKPFQRLLKYSVLFHALLYHTDPCMLEYEGARQLVAEIEDVIRGIEDAKNHQEKRHKTRDVLARIKGLERAVQFAVPEPSRFLVGELMLNPQESSDVLRSSGGSIGARNDVWLVVFNDVVLRCQRTGIISLPLGVAQSELHAATGCRNSSARSRNLYKFIKASVSST